MNSKFHNRKRKSLEPNLNELDGLTTSLPKQCPKIKLSKLKINKALNCIPTSVSIIVNPKHIDQVYACKLC